MFYQPLCLSLVQEVEWHTNTHADEGFLIVTVSDREPCFCSRLCM